MVPSPNVRTLIYLGSSTQLLSVFSFRSFFVDGGPWEAQLVMPKVEIGIVWCNSEKEKQLAACPILVLFLRVSVAVTITITGLDRVRTGVPSNKERKRDVWPLFASLVPVSALSA